MLKSITICKIEEKSSLDQRYSLILLTVMNKLVTIKIIYYLS